MRAMILAAGLGTRLKPFTDKHPKALVKVNGKTLLQRNIEYLALFGIKELIVNVHHFADQVIKEIEDHRGFGSDVKISDEADELLETGGGLKKAAWFLNTGEPFVLMNVDILTDVDIRKMIDFHNAGNNLATLAVMTRKSSRYFLFDETGMLSGWRNSKSGDQKISREANKYVEKAFSGIHVISPEIFSLISFEGKFSMVDVYLDLAKSHHIAAFDHSDSKFIDVGKPERIQMAEGLFK